MLSHIDFLVAIVDLWAKDAYPGREPVKVSITLEGGEVYTLPLTGFQRKVSFTQKEAS